MTNKKCWFLSLLPVVGFFIFSCANQNNEELSNQDNFRNYLANTFQIQFDTLDNKVVLVDYIGCKPCVNKSLKYFFNSGNIKQDFIFIVPNSKRREFNQYYCIEKAKNEFSEMFLSERDMIILVDSNNTIYRQNIRINGLSVYHISDGEIQKMKTIEIDNLNQSELEQFWFDW